MTEPLQYELVVKRGEWVRVFHFEEDEDTELQQFKKALESTGYEVYISLQDSTSRKIN